MIRLFVSDLDGTLLNRIKTVDLKDLHAINQWKKAGNLFMVASGRNANYVPMLKTLKVEPYAYVGGTGSQILYPDGTLENIHAFTKEETEAITAYLYANDVSFSIIGNNGSHHRYHHASTKKTARDLFSFFEAKDYYKYETIDPYKFYMTFNTAEESDAFQKEFLKNFDVEAPHPWESDIEVIPKGCTKWNAVLRLIETTPIQPEEVACIGDTENDLEMIQNCGYGFSMKNAPDKVKKASKKVVSSVAEAIDYLLEKKEN